MYKFYACVVIFPVSIGLLALTMVFDITEYRIGPGLDNALGWIGYIRNNTEIIQNPRNVERARKSSYMKMLKLNKDDLGVDNIRQFWRKKDASCKNLTTDQNFDLDWEQWLEEPRESNISSQYYVENIVHYVWINDKTGDLSLHHVISLLGAHVNLHPDRIYFHTNSVPKGRYWRIARKIPELIVVKRTPKKCVFGVSIPRQRQQEIQSDLERLLIVLEHGGIYLDLDVIPTKSFGDLRECPCTLGVDEYEIVCNAVIICSKFSTFLLLWTQSFLSDFSTEWAVNGGRKPFEMARRFPFAVHLQWRRLFEPSDRHIDELWTTNTTIVPFNYTDNYAIHLWNVARRHYGYYYLTLSDLWRSGGVYAQVARDVIAKSRSLIGQVLDPQ